MMAPTNRKTLAAAPAVVLTVKMSALAACAADNPAAAARPNAPLVKGVTEQ